jgi:hypothetical protein
MVHCLSGSRKFWIRIWTMTLNFTKSFWKYLASC